MFDSIKQWFVDILKETLQWFLDAVQWLGKTIFKELMEGLSSLIEALPVPDFVSNAGSFFGSLPSGVIYFLNFFAIQEGMTMILAAYVLRFAIRRIPFIG
jgi:hypothetical protein